MKTPKLYYNKKNVLALYTIHVNLLSKYLTVCLVVLRFEKGFIHNNIKIHVPSFLLQKSIEKSIRLSTSVTIAKCKALKGPPCGQVV